MSWFINDVYERDIAILNLIIAVFLAELGKYRFDGKKRNTIKHKNLLSRIKMGKEILTFVYIEIERKKITAVRLQFFLKDVDIEKVLVSKKISFGEKKL